MGRSSECGLEKVLIFPFVVVRIPHKAQLFKLCDHFAHEVRCVLEVGGGGSLKEGHCGMGGGSLSEGRCGMGGGH